MADSHNTLPSSPSVAAFRSRKWILPVVSASEVRKPRRGDTILFRLWVHERYSPTTTTTTTAAAAAAGANAVLERVAVVGKAFRVLSPTDPRAGEDAGAVVMKERRRKRRRLKERRARAGSAALATSAEARSSSSSSSSVSGVATATAADNTLQPEDEAAPSSLPSETHLIEIATIHFHSAPGRRLRGNPVLSFCDRFEDDTKRPAPVGEAGAGYELLASPDETTAPVDNCVYALASGDLNPIHRNPYAAALAGLPGTIGE